MKLNIRLSLFALLLLLVMPTKQIFALNASREGWQQIETDSAETIAVRINAHRQRAGLEPYSTNQALLQAAQKIADHMAATEFISHFDGDGANPNSRAAQFGYADHVTEIIYGGFGGSDAAWEWWMANELHEALILSQDYYEMGVGVAMGAESDRLYWAVVFGTGLPAKEDPTPLAIAPSSLTKLPPNVTTAVPSPSPTAEQLPTETAVAAHSETAIPTSDTGSAQSSQDEAALPSNLGTPTQVQDETARGIGPQDTWLILAAAVTIFFGIILFYFPRAGWSR
jgi:uncharacterized protein YkwD